MSYTFKKIFDIYYASNRINRYSKAYFLNVQESANISAYNILGSSEIISVVCKFNTGNSNRYNSRRPRPTKLKFDTQRMSVWFKSNVPSEFHSKNFNCFSSPRFLNSSKISANTLSFTNQLLRQNVVHNKMKYDRLMDLIKFGENASKCLNFKSF